MVCFKAPVRFYDRVEQQASRGGVQESAACILAMARAELDDCAVVVYPVVNPVEEFRGFSV